MRIDLGPPGPSVRRSPEPTLNPESRINYHPILWETARPYFYARHGPDGRMMIGGEPVNE